MISKSVADSTLQLNNFLLATMSMTSYQAFPSDSIDFLDHLENAEEKTKNIPSRMLSTDSGSDYFAMTMGIVGSIGSGASSAIFCIIFGIILDTLNRGTSQSEIEEILGYLPIVGFGVLLTSCSEKVWWTVAGEEQTLTLKNRYFPSMPLQDTIRYGSKCGSWIGNNSRLLTLSFRPP